MNTGKLKQHLQARVSVEVLDQQDRTLEVREKDCDLVLNNWLQWAGASSLPFYNSNYLSLVDESGTVNNYMIRDWNYGQYAFTDALTKISIGNGTTPPNPADFRLASELQRSGVLSPSSWTNPETGRFLCTFFNTFATNLNITVSEVGLWIRSTFFGKEILIARDLIDPPIQVPAGGAVKVTYSLVMAVVRG